jgi:hypothetical protein
MATAIQATSQPPSRPLGGAQAMMPNAQSSGAESMIHDRRRPSRWVVRSERLPTSGSDTASHSFAARKTIPIAAAETPRSSTANFRYMIRISTYMNWAGTAARP